jgi:two-component system sensor histidine kinase/response regulator
MSFFSKEKIKQADSTKNEKKAYTILIVDDEPANIRFLKGLLEDEYNILTAGDGQEAIELIQSHPNPQEIQLIISDQRMPKKSGVEFLKETIESIPKSIRIILTGFTDIEAVIAAINAGKVYNFLNKPISPQDLKITIKRAIETFELERKNDLLVEELKTLNSSLEKKVEERTIELKEINELQKALVQTIVHDLKNPLSNIIMFSKHIETRNPPPEKTVELSQKINRSGRHMAKMVENLLDIYKIEQGIIFTCLDTFDLVPVVSQTQDVFAENAAKKNINLQYETTVERGPILADMTQTKRVFENLVSNAIKFSPPDKSIYITLEKQDGNYITCIKDEGPGLTQEDKAKLFQKFSRLSAQATGGEHSTGLGLSIVKSLVEVMKGKVWCESEEGHGASFFVSFPEKVD